MKIPGKVNMGECKENGSIAKELTEIPDYSNNATRATEARLGPFVFDQESSEKNKDVVDRGPYELDNEAIYHG